jgi:hypothetical protein
MKLRSLFITFVTVMMLTFGAASAQDFDPCFGLSDADCAEINTATQASIATLATAESFSTGWSIDFALSGLAGLGLPDITFNNAGTIDVTSSMNPVIPFNVGIMQDVSFSGFEQGDGSLDIRVVDGFLYIENPNPELEEWISIDLVEIASDPEGFANDFLGEAGLGDLDTLGVDPAEPEAVLEDLPVDPMQLLALTELVTIDGVTNYTRDGNTFSFVVDLTALSAIYEPGNEELVNNLNMLLDTADPSGALSQTLPDLLMLIDQATITVTQQINPDLGAVDTIGFSINATFDAMGMMMGMESGQEPASITLDFQTNVNNLGSAPAAVAPENAEPLDLSGGMEADG